MKLFLLTLLAAMTSLAAFAQGKVVFVNDSLHAYYMSADAARLNPADAALAGQRTPIGGLLPSGVILKADLYAGTSAGSLTLISSATMSGAVPGRQLTSNVTLPLPGGVATYFQVQIRDSLFQSAYESVLGGSYWGYSLIFTTIPGTGAGYNSIISTIAPAFSTWANGTYDLGAAGFGAVEVFSEAPEPSTLSLLGLGIAALLTFRRRQ